MAFIRITMREAKKRFAAGLPVVLCPCNMYPGGMWSSHVTITPSKWIEDRRYFNHPDTPNIFHGYIVEEAWDMMYREWEHYNASYGARYAHFYRED